MTPSAGRRSPRNGAHRASKHRGTRRWSSTVFDEAKVTHDEFADRYLLNVIIANHGCLLIFFNFALQTTKLSFFSPVIEGSDEHNHKNGDKDGHAFNPLEIGYNEEIR